MPCRKQKKLEEQEEREEELEEDSDVTEDDLDLPAEGDTHTPQHLVSSLALYSLPHLHSVQPPAPSVSSRNNFSLGHLSCVLNTIFLLCSAHPGTNVGNGGPVDAKNIVLVWLRVPS